MKTFSLTKFPLENKRIFLRVDYNVPLKEGQIVDNLKIKASLPTIKFLLEKNCKIILATHLGKPQGKVVQQLKTNLLAEELKKLLPNEKITKLDDCIGKDIKTKIIRAKQKEIIMLENLRFYKEEGENDFTFAHSLADLAEVYVNDAFAVCHRKNASLSAITKFLPAVSGFLLEKEIFNLGQALKPDKNNKPAVWIMGGAKLDKVDLIQQALKKADQILIGGALAFPFLKTKGINIGVSKIDKNSINLAKNILKKKKNQQKIILPLDFIVTEKFQPRTKTRILNYNEITAKEMALDIGPKTVALFKDYLVKAKTIVWNGPLGYFEWAEFARGTKEIGRFLERLDVIKIAGGGETAEAIHKFHLDHNFTHVSTGGGASLMFLSGRKMPGLIALEKNYQKFKKNI